MKKTQDKYKEEMEQQLLQHEKDKSNSEAEFKKNLQAEKDKVEALTKQKLKEVNDVFENEDNLAFIMKMRDFKKTWTSETSVQKRKSTAAQMAETTKKWVSSHSK